MGGFQMILSSLLIQSKRWWKEYQTKLLRALLRIVHGTGILQAFKKNVKYTIGSFYFPSLSHFF